MVSGGCSVSQRSSTSAVYMSIASQHSRGNLGMCRFWPCPGGHRLASAKYMYKRRNTKKEQCSCGSSKRGCWFVSSPNRSTCHEHTPVTCVKPALAWVGCIHGEVFAGPATVNNGQRKGMQPAPRLVSGRISSQQPHPVICTALTTARLQLN